ncbi:nucleotide exchange factor GrpE [Clostridium sp. MSJ-4]|uniref:Protein GrpE n=1 Tax=Clostridium simiarum TaxID=2841506 RepID=A0ABS6EXT2_9CLOT|nr:MULTISPECIES: nucleotide exchange factor GrpE [Clostridium]MBU5591034.1 nucleotide exchange factor GrpE [Clostridium simiarum]
MDKNNLNPEVKSEEDILEEDNLKEELGNEEELKEAEVLEDEEFEKVEDFSEINKYKEEVDRLNEENNTLKDRLLRVTAEYDNYRKRTAKEKEGIYSDACEDILKNLLPVLDNLERAAIIDGSAEDIKKGVEMTLRQFNDAFEKLQVEEIVTEEGFDPNMHNAVMHVEDESFDEKQIVEVFQKGYKRGDKVIRYSMVKVAN